MNSNVMVIGGGISGIEAALSLGEQGYKVILVEKSSSVGGRMAQLDKTFPTLDCSICILSPKMVRFLPVLGITSKTVLSLLHCTFINSNCPGAMKLARTQVLH